MAKSKSKSKSAPVVSDSVKPDRSQIGQTSSENPVAADRSSQTPSSPANREFPLFNLMLLISLICVTAATVLLYLALQEYGTGFYQWRVSEF